MPRRSRNYKTGLYERLQDDSEMLMYLQTAAEDSSPVFLMALRDVAEARGMSKLAQESNLNREHLYRILAEGGNPQLTSLTSLLEALGLRLSVEKAGTAAKAVECTTGTVLEMGKAHFCFDLPATETELMTGVGAEETASTPTWANREHPMYDNDSEILCALSA